MLEACLDKLKEHLQIANSGSMNDNMLYPQILKMCSSLQTAITALANVLFFPLEAFENVVYNPSHYF